MKIKKHRIWNLKEGDIIRFTNNAGYKVEREVIRVEEKSWYAPNRKSYGTLADYEKSFPDFEIIKKIN